MKNPLASASLYISLLIPALGAAPVSAQDLREDTLAVRILLDQNGLLATPVSQVAEIDRGAARVSALRLGGRGISSLPPQIAALDALKYLVLSDNLLDSLPAELWDLPGLVELDLGGNRIAALDAGVGRLKSLLFLGLRQNGLAALPDSLFALPQLETLLLSGNALDTLPEAVAGLPFLKYLDLSGNALRSLPYTVAALDLDTLDVSSNALVSLPAAITGMRAAARVRLIDNRLCDLPADVAAWADGKDPAWRNSQICGSPVRPRPRATRGPALRAWADGDGLRLDWSGTESLKGERDLILRDAAGRQVARLPVAAGSSGLSLPRAAGGFLWAELRVGNRVAAKAVVAP